MPRYYFHVQDGQSLIDEDGTELIGLDDARTAAVNMAGQMMRDAAKQFWREGKWRLDVASPTEVTLFTLVFAAFDAPIIGYKERRVT